jgi:hypothetical protein
MQYTSTSQTKRDAIQIGEGLFENRAKPFAKKAGVSAKYQ